MFGRKTIAALTAERDRLLSERAGPRNELSAALRSVEALRAELARVRADLLQERNVNAALRGQLMADPHAAPPPADP